MNSIAEIFTQSVLETEKTIPDDTFSFSQKNNDGIDKHYSITPSDYEKALNNKFGDFSNFSRIFTDHLLGLKNIAAAFASTPVSFYDAWNMKSEGLIAEDVYALTKNGGHFQFNQIPNGANNSGSALYQTGFAKGLVHPKSGLTKGDFRIKHPMPEYLRLGCSYDKISRDKKKRNLLISYAVENSLRCPGEECNHAFFNSLQPKNIHVGHRISQKWNSQNSGVADVHHPYNLYLSCGRCNIILSQKYPTEIDKLIDDLGTIGDWLMKDLLVKQS